MMQSKQPPRHSLNITAQWSAWCRADLILAYRMHHGRDHAIEQQGLLQEGQLLLWGQCRLFRAADMEGLQGWLALLADGAGISQLEAAYVK